MCLIPMTCNLRLGCICMANFFFDINTLTCKAKYSYTSGPCTSDYQCREDQNLICTNSKCVCPSTVYTWSNNQTACKLTLSQGMCSSDSDCNLSEYLSCDITGTCDCVRRDGFESYYDGNLNKCVPVLTFGQETCTTDAMCSSLTQLTY